jgi:nucleotide-binding universal stress UspA family protein
MTAVGVQTSIALDRILLATELGAESVVPTSYAAGLAERYSSTLELANVLDLSGNSLAFAELLEPALESMRHTADVGLEKVGNELSVSKIEKRVLEGFQPWELLLGEATRFNADLIVLGTSSKRGFTKLLLGSTAEEVVRRATCPVLTVGPHVPLAAPGPLHFRRIVFATDLSHLAEKAFCYAAALASGDDAELSVCRVISKEQGTREEDELFVSSVLALRKLIEKTSTSCKTECVIEHGKVAEEILSLAAKSGADLIVLAARKSSFWLTYLHTGLTPILLAEAKCPVLTLC